MKRLIYILLAGLMLAAVIIPGAASASGDRSALDSITTPHIILCEAESGAVLYDKSAYTKAFPASTTKIMTCVVVLENCDDIDAQYVCGPEAQNGFYAQSSLLGLKAGYKVTIRDMLYGLMLCSGNDCGACLAHAIAGSEEAFVEMMNSKAIELGMTGTHYTNPHGLHNEEHYTTAYDMAQLMIYALKNPTFRELIATKEYTVVEMTGKFTKEIQTSNKFLYTKDTDWEENLYEYAIGGKTGETNIAGYCLVEAAEKDGITLVTVLMGDKNGNTGTSPYYRFHNARKLFEYGFAQYASYELSSFHVSSDFTVQTTDYSPSDLNNGLVSAEVDISEVKVEGCITDLMKITANSFSWQEPVLDEEAIKAPVEVGDKLGTVTLFKDGAPFYTGDLIATSSVAGIVTEPEVTSVPSNLIDKKITGKRDVSNLTVSKNGGDAEYTVWVYYKNTMFTMQDELTWHYLFCDGDVFRSAKVPGTEYELQLYRLVTDGAGNSYCALSDGVLPGEKYVIVSKGMALQSVKKGRSLAAVPVTADENGVITSAVTEDMLWSFNESGRGYQLISNGLYLHRNGGNGLLFWILMGVLVIALIIIIRLLATSRRRRRNPRRRGRYKIYRM